MILRNLESRKNPSLRSNWFKPPFRVLIEDYHGKPLDSRHKAVKEETEETAREGNVLK